METKDIAGLKATIEALITAGTNFDIQMLDKLYHKTLKVVMISEEGEKLVADKIAFMDVFRSKLENKEPKLNTWADIHHLDVNNKNGHAVLSRKVNLTGQEQTLFLSIDFIWNNDYWQVTREIIFSKIT